MSATNNRFLQSSLTSNDLATETTFKGVSDRLTETLDVSGNVNVSSLTITDVDMPGIEIDGMEKLAEQIGARYRGRTYQRLGEPEQ